jgi:phosphoribosylanthranilate isomerase
VFTRIKICGLTRLADAVAAVEAGADALGFVFVPGTPRFITPAHAAAIVRELPPFVTKVGLFVNAPETVVRETVAAAGLDTVQLHGEETPEFAAALRGTVKVLKAFRVRGAASLELVPPYRYAVDAFLLDAFVAGAHGGTGAKFDWPLALPAKKCGRPVILAGGLTPENAAEAVRQVRPFAVDVSSGVESAPGLKDAEKVRRFIANARSVGREWAQVFP